MGRDRYSIRACDESCCEEETGGSLQRAVYTCLVSSNIYRMSFPLTNVSA